MQGSLLKVLLIAVLATFALKWLRKMLSPTNSQGAGGGSPWPGTRKTEDGSRTKLKVLQFRSDPLEVLGLGPGANEDEIKVAYQGAMAENAPEKVAEMDFEFRELARRRQLELTAAYQQLLGEE